MINTSRAKRQANNSVIIENHNGRVRLRWTYQGKRYCLALKAQYSPTSVKVANGVKSRIELDMLTGTFDESLDRYRPQKPKQQPPPKLPTHLLEIWDAWVESLKLSPRTANGHYKNIRVRIVKYNPSILDTQWIEDSNYCAVAYNSYVSYLRRCIDWAVTKKLVVENPYTNLPRRKGKRKRRQPFTREEAIAIIVGFRKLKPHYADFVEALFLLGCRPSELIGLRVKDIDLHKEVLSIPTVLARSDEGRTSAKHRVRKETKTGTIKRMKMSKRLIHLLSPLLCDKPPDALVFTSPKGLAIDDKNWGGRDWRSVLSALDIAYRVPYCTRHTFATLALEDGVSITQISSILGHVDTSMVARTYGHLLNQPTLPDLL